MSVRDLFESKPEQIEEVASENEDAGSRGKLNDLSGVSNRELRRRVQAIHIGRKADTRAKREKKKMLEKMKVVYY